MGGFADYYGHASVHPLALAVLLACGVAMILLPRRYAVLPVVVIACTIPMAQRLVIMGMDFDFLRMMVVFGCVRVILRGEVGGLTWKPIDTLFVLWMVSGTVIFLIQQKTEAALVYRLGTMFNAGGMYFVFRCLIRGWEDVDGAAFCFAVVVIPLMGAFLYEWLALHNPFSIFGGVSASPQMRMGEVRCTGAFSHPIMAGCFWAASVPLIASRWWTAPSARFWTALAVAAAVIIVLLSNSSTSMMALAAVVVGAAGFRLRRSMKTVRWGVLATLVLLHIVMKAPVWHLIARVDVTGGSAGWQRYKLIDNAIKHFDEWWLIGTRTTAHWDGPVMIDINNQYINAGVHGGLLTMVLLIALLSIAFKNVGALRRLHEDDRPTLAMTWALGVCVFTHAMTWMGISYFGQTNFVLYLHLAIVGSLAPHLPQAREASEALSEPEDTHASQPAGALG